MTPREHLVQFYGSDEARLIRNVSRYLGEALERGGAAIIVVRPALRDSFRAELSRGTVVYFDAEELLAELLDERGHPDPFRFESRVATMLRELHETHGTVRAYGEMVGILWSRGAYAAAIELESLWNELLVNTEFGLFCGYPISVLGSDFQIACVQPVLASHTEVVPATAHTFDIALHRAMEGLLGERSHGLRQCIGDNLRFFGTSLPPTEETILRLRSALPRYADKILELARVADQA